MTTILIVLAVYVAGIVVCQILAAEANSTDQELLDGLGVSCLWPIVAAVTIFALPGIVSRQVKRSLAKKEKK